MTEPTRTSGAPAGEVPALASAPAGSPAGSVPHGRHDADDGAAVVIRTDVAVPEAALASLDLTRGAIGRLDAEEVNVTFGAIGAARADRIEVELGAVGAAMANELAVTQGAAGTVLAGNATLEGALVRTLVARRVVVRRPSVVAFLLARRVSGDVRVLFDWRGALLFGVVFGLIARFGRRRR